MRLIKHEIMASSTSIQRGCGPKKRTSVRETLIPRQTVEGLYGVQEEMRGREWTMSGNDVAKPKGGGLPLAPRDKCSMKVQPYCEHPQGSGPVVDPEVDEGGVPGGGSCLKVLDSGDEVDFGRDLT